MEGEGNEGNTVTPVRKFVLQAEHELRFEIPTDTTTASLTLEDGSVELFGIELAVNRETLLPPGFNAAAFTWHGATLSLNAPQSVMAYTASETPMPTYIAAHQVLQSQRMLAKNAGMPAPRAVIVGPRDSGKTAVISVLTAYCVKENGSAIVVDADPSGCGVTAMVPASIALSVVKHLDLDNGGLVHDKVTSLMMGHSSPKDNPLVSEKVYAGMGDILDRALACPQFSSHVGCLVDTSGDIEGKEGTETVIKAIEALKADVVFVVGAERLYATIRSRFEQSKTHTVLLPKSGGVISRDDTTRMAIRSARLKEYFYGVDNVLNPFSTVIDFSDIRVLKVGGVAASVPDSALPIGAQSTLDPLKPFALTVLGDVLHKILGVSQAKTEEDVMKVALYGFVHVVKIDSERNTLTVLAPSPGKIPGKIFLAGDTKWIE